MYSVHHMLAITAWQGCLHQLQRCAPAASQACMSTALIQHAVAASLDTHDGVLMGAAWISTGPGLMQTAGSTRWQCHSTTGPATGCHSSDCFTRWVHAACFCHPCCTAQVKEFDRPSTLLENPRSMFNMLVEDTGPVASTMLRQMAAAGPQDERSVSQDAPHSCSLGSRPASLDLGGRAPTTQ